MTVSPRLLPLRHFVLHVLAYAGVLTTLVATAPSRVVGDAGEYSAYALALARGHGPGLTEADVATLRHDLAAVDPALEQWDLVGNAHRRRDGRLEFVHFWLYPALAVPFVLAARLINLNPLVGFAVVNLALLVTAFAVSLRRLPWPAVWLLFAGPIVWWADKAHPEALVFSLTTVAFVAWRDRPWLAFVSLGVVAAQVPVFAIFLPLLGGAAVLETRGQSRSTLFAALAASVMIAAWPVLHYLSTFGTPTLLASASRPHWPTSGEVSTVLWDLNLGLVPNWPLFATAVAGTVILLIVRAPRRLLRPDIAVALVGASGIVASGLQIGNLMAGATPGILRYAVWLVPLSVPLFLAASDEWGWRESMLAIAVVSVPIGLVAYRPSIEEFAHRPTWIAESVWHRAPAWSRPLAEVFVKSLRQRELPAATKECDKLLLVGRGVAQGMWPRPCSVTDVPDECRRPAALCYANRHGRNYDFDPLDEAPGDLRYNPGSVWPRNSETAVRSAMLLVDWWTLGRIEPSIWAATIRTSSAVTVESVFESDGRLFAVFTNTRADASVGLLTLGGGHGVLVDGETGEVLDQPRREGSSAASWELPLPSSHRLLILAIARSQ